MNLLGISRNMLLSPSHDLKHIGGGKLTVIGSSRIQIRHNGKCVETEVYFIQAIQHMYLSLDVCKDLNIVPTDFPKSNVQSASVAANSQPSKKSLPIRPTQMPYSPEECNIELLEKWLFDAFADSTFKINADVLPTMKTKPHRIHVKEGTVPYAAHTPIQIAHH